MSVQQHQWFLSFTPRYLEARALALAILEKNPDDQEVREKLAQMDAEQRAIDEMWEKKLKDLENARDLQVLYSSIDAISVEESSGEFHPKASAHCQAACNPASLHALLLLLTGFCARSRSDRCHHCQP